MFIDTHAHLFYPDYKDDIDEVIQRAKQEEVEAIVVPSTDLASAKKVLELTQKYDIVYGTVGIHPHDTKEWKKEYINDLEQLAKQDKIIAIGEIGLDYYYDFSPKEIQKEAFIAQLELALKLKLPVVVHNREADKDILDIIGSFCGRGLKAQFHCFSSSLDVALELIKMNHFISFTGNITHKKADDLRAVVSKIPLDNIMIETDSPFMTPVPLRGKRNEPAYVKYVAMQLAELHNKTVEEIGKITSFNAFRFFGIGRNAKTDYTYLLGDSLYINVTNRCSADCVFCHRKTDPTIGRYNLKMSASEEPPASVYINEIGNPKNYKEIVFCGYGEPTIRWEVVKEISTYIKENGGKVRINTNGHGNLINKRDITVEMKGIIDTLSISLNSSNPKQYAQLMQVDEKYFYEMIEFTRAAKQNVPNVIMSIVNLKDVDIDAAQNIADELGVQLRIRQHFD